MTANQDSNGSAFAVDLVDELERILRGQADDGGHDARGSGRRSAQHPAGAWTDGGEAADPDPEHNPSDEAVWQALEASDAAFGSPQPDGTAADDPYAAGGWDAEGYEPADPDEPPPEDDAYWAARQAYVPDAEDRRGPMRRGDMIIVALLVLLVGGLGIFAALGGFSSPTTAATDTTLTVADISGLSVGDTPRIVGGAPAADPAPSPQAPATPAADPLAEEPAAVPDGLVLENPGPVDEARVPADPNPPAAAAPAADQQQTPRRVEIIPIRPPAQSSQALALAANDEPQTPPGLDQAVIDPPAARPQAAAPAASTPAPSQPAAAPPSGGSSGTARVAVNMRGGPDNGAPILGVVQAGSPVTVYSCDLWCEVEVGGQRGWIFNTFLTR